MSSDRDEAVYEAIGGDPSELEDGGDSNTVELPATVWQSVLAQLGELENRVERIENGSDVLSDDALVIDRFAAMSEEQQEQTLSTSERIAITLHTNWEDIAWDLGGGGSIHGTKVENGQVIDTGEGPGTRLGVDTKSKAAAKYNPSRLRHRLKQHLNRDFQSTEIYRGLERLAKLAGGEEHVDEVAGRVHVTDGLYEYHEKATTDGSDVRRVLWRVEE